MNTFVLLLSMNELGLLSSNFHRVLNTKVVLNIVEIMLTKIIMFA
jgi:hypothetical protein